MIRFRWFFGLVAFAVVTGCGGSVGEDITPSSAPSDVGRIASAVPRSVPTLPSDYYITRSTATTDSLSNREAPPPLAGNSSWKTSEEVETYITQPYRPLTVNAHPLN